MPYDCKGACKREIYRLMYDITKGLPHTMKNRLYKKKCRRCSIWMMTESLRCFCCGQMLTRKIKKLPSFSRKWRDYYPTFEALKMNPCYVDKTLNKR